MNTFVYCKVVGSVIDSVCVPVCSSHQHNKPSPTIQCLEKKMSKQNMKARGQEKDRTICCLSSHCVCTYTLGGGGRESMGEISLVFPPFLKQLSITNDCGPVHTTHVTFFQPLFTRMCVRLRGHRLSPPRREERALKEN